MWFLVVGVGVLVGQPRIDVAEFGGEGLEFAVELGEFFLQGLARRRETLT